MQTATLHVKVEPEIVRGLKQLAQKRQVSVGELVRQAVVSRYQLDFALSLSNNQRRALEAYQGGYISLSKLARDMGMDVWEMRDWLDDHGVAQNNSFNEDDVANA